MSNETEQLDVVSPEVYRMMEYGSEERRNQEIASYESILRFIAALPSDKQALALTIGENLIGYQIYHGIDSDEVRSQIEQYGEDLPLLQTIGYKEALTVIRGELIDIGRFVTIGSMSMLDTEKIIIGEDSRINEYVIVGPSSDPAQVSSAKTHEPSSSVASEL